MELYIDLFQCSKELGNECVSCEDCEGRTLIYFFNDAACTPSPLLKLGYTLPKLGTLEQTRLSF